MTNRVPTVIDLPSMKGNTRLDDRLTEPMLYESVLSRRCIAFLIDCVVLSCLFMLCILAKCTITVMTFGALTPLALAVVALLPIIYGTWSIAGWNSATPGMRAMDLTVRTWRGERPEWLHAFLMTSMFYVTAVPLGGLLLLFALFDGRHRCLHDHLSGVIVVRRSVLQPRD